jgi:predicted negative regulator of RcsB-dependent stress response
MAKSKQQHGDTEIPLRGFEAQLQTGFEWISQHPRQVLSVLGGIVLIGALVAFTYEWRTRTENRAARELEKIEKQFAESMGADPRVALVPEPANADQARQSREEALSSLEHFLRYKGGSRAAVFASIRAAEMEADLGRLDAAETRLTEGLEELAMSDPVRPTAQRLLAWVQEERGRYGEAADTYAAVARTPGYGDPAGVWFLAAEAYRRAGNAARAGDSYRMVLDTDAAYASRKRVQDLIALLEAEDTVPPERAEPSPSPEPESPPTAP